MKKLTIFTPTYNRGHLLERLYHSLCRQTEKNFEWLIVDDASTDNTETVVKSFMENNNDFSIRYYKQEHGGKHRAINKAVKLATGDYFFIIDSDDYIMDNTVELIKIWTADIDDKLEFAGVAGLRVSMDGNVWGGEVLVDKNVLYIDANNFQRRKYNLFGDKAEIYKLKVLKEYPFPEFEGEYFISEGVCWDAIAAAGLKLRWYNIPIYKSEYLQDGLTKTGANSIKGNIQNYKGFCYNTRQSMKVKPLKERIISFRAFNRTGIAMKKTLSTRAKDLGFTKKKYILYLVLIPVLGVPIILEMLVRKIRTLS